MSWTFKILTLHYIKFKKYWIQSNNKKFIIYIRKFLSALYEIFFSALKQLDNWEFFLKGLLFGPRKGDCDWITLFLFLDYYCIRIQFFLVKRWKKIGLYFKNSYLKILRKAVSHRKGFRLRAQLEWHTQLKPLNVINHLLWSHFQGPI